MSSLISSELLKVFESAKHQLNLQTELKRFENFKAARKERRRQMRENMKKIGHKHSEQQNKFDATKIAQRFKDFKYHSMSLDELIQLFQTDTKKGLTQQQAEQRLKQGQNKLKEVQQTHWALIFLSQMSDPFSILIWFIVVLAFIGYFLLNDPNQLLLSILLIVTLLSGAIISYGFAQSSNTDLKNFKQFFPQFSTVIRDAQPKIVKSTDIVPGDLIVLSPGDPIPADIRIIKSNNMKINKAAFTGQSAPVQIIVEEENSKQNIHDRNHTKFIEEQAQDESYIFKKKQVNPLDAQNIVFSGCINEQGEGLGIVIQTGQKMLIASIRDVLTTIQSKKSYLQDQIAFFVKCITVFSLCVGLYTFFGGWIVGFPVVIAANIAIGVTCASCPGVLNLELTCLLYLSIKKLAKKSMMCKTLQCVQTLGSTQILCIDKTGTLTTNRMTVQNLLYDSKVVKGTNYEDYSQNYKHQYSIKQKTFYQLQKCAVLSSIAQFTRSLPKQSVNKIQSRRDLKAQQKRQKLKQMQKSWQQSYKNLKWKDKQVTGDSAQTALVRFFQPIEDIKQTRYKYPLTIQTSSNSQNRVVFNSDIKYSMSINYNSNAQNQNCTVYLKGAPEMVWEMCRYIMVNGQIKQKNIENEQFYLNIFKKWGNQGKHVMAFCCLNLPQHKTDKNQKIITPQRFIDEREYRLKQMIFIGAISMQDPPRKNVQKSMLKIKKAGIKIIVITGDLQSTAVSIARQCKLLSIEKTTSQLILEENINFKQAFTRSQNIVVNGEQIQEMIQQDQMKSQSQRGKQMHKILSKPNILFARVSPPHKLYIIETLKNLGYVVAFVGDGVNDSPGIKVANTGIAMISGSETCRDAADIILGNDDLENLLLGIQQGRKVFDNFKKAICYVMTSQVSQWMPFIYLILSRVPIPIFTLLVDGAADFVPTLAFAYQQAEEGIMTRPPKFKQQRLVNFRLIAQSQGWMGFSSFLCCLFAYYIIMVDFGFVPSNLWGKSNDFILLENKWDFYNPTSRFLGNTNLQQIKSCQQFDSKKVRVDWINTTYPNTDLRMSAVRCITEASGIRFQQYYKFGPCKIQQISIYTFKPICYTPEATKYGQSSYMFANVVNQIFNWIMCRTRRDSAVLKRFNNPIFVFGLGAEAMMGFSLAYSTPWIWMIGTRDVAFEHFGISAIPFSIIQLLLDELRKYLIRNLPPDKNGKPNWFVRNTLW